MIGGKRSTAGALALLVVASGCAAGLGEEDSESPAACGLIDRDLVSALADGRDWTDAGKLYRDGKVSDGCAVLVSGQQLLLVTLVDFSGSDHAASARQTLLAEPDAFQRTCPGTIPAPVTEDSVTSVCLSERKLDYNEWNPRRLVRLTIDRTPGVSLSADDAVRLSEDINRRADELEK